MKPTVGRVVHYQPQPGPGRTGQPWAAIITEILSPRSIRLHLLTPSGQYEEHKRSFEAYDYSDEPRPGHWNWPPREPAPERHDFGVHTAGGGVMPVHAQPEGTISVTLVPGHSGGLDTVSAAAARMAARRRY